MKKHSRFRVARRALLIWCLFIGVGALFGSACMLLRPDGSVLGMQSMLIYFQVLPFAETLFQNYVFSGIALLCVNGLTNLLAAALLLKGRDAGVRLGGAFGVTLMLWIVIQFVIFPPNVLSTSYFFFGLAQALTGYAAWVFLCQERFAARTEVYPNIGKNPKRLVVYFSRMGYAKKIACEEADRLGASLYEVVATERTEGTPGFWWCGRYGMHRWPMPIRPIDIDLTAYERVTICAPVWVFHLCAPMRFFLMAARGRVRRADYIIIHHQRASYPGVIREMDDLLGVRADTARSVRCRRGVYGRFVSLRDGAKA